MYSNKTTLNSWTGRRPTTHSYIANTAVAGEKHAADCAVLLARRCRGVSNANIILAPGIEARLAHKRHHQMFAFRLTSKPPQAGATGRCEVALPLGTPGAPEGIEPELASRVVVLEYNKNNQSLLFQTNGLSSMRYCSLL